MSNGIGANPLNAISKVYLEQIVEKKDDSYLEPDMKKRQKNNEKARKDMEKMGTSMKNPHFESLDPVGKEDGDVNNDGKKDSTDSYLMKRRKAIGKAIKGKMMKKESVQQVTEGDGDPCWDTHKQVGMKKKGNRMVPNCVPKTKTESFSAWRQDLSEIMTDDIDSKPIKEKKVVNKIKINPKLGEAIEDIGGSIVEMVEVDEAVYGGEPAKKEAPKDTRMTVTNADRKANTPAYQKYKAGHKGYKAADHMKEGIRDTDPEKGTAERKARLEKKRGMKMDDHPQYKKEEVEVAEADSLAAMQARREKRLAAQRKREGTTATGRDFGHDYSLTPAQQKARRDAEFKAGIGTKKEEVENVDEALTGQRQMRARDMKGTPYQKGGGKRTARDNKTLHNLATRNDGPGTPGYEKKSTGGKGGRKFAGYGDQGAGNKARRRAGEQPMRGNRDPRNEEFTSEEASMTTQELQLQKKKARIDRMIAQKRQQDLSKKKSGSDQPAKAMGEGMECVHNPKGKNCPVHGKEECPALTKEEASDAMKDRRMERGGVGGNVDYRRPPAAPNLAGKKKPAGGMSALERVKAEIRAKHGKGAIMDTKKK